MKIPMQKKGHQLPCRKDVLLNLLFGLFYVIVTVVILVFTFIIVKSWMADSLTNKIPKNEKFSFDLTDIPNVNVDDEAPVGNPRNQECTFWNCFDVYRCGYGHHEKISIYVYPFRRYENSQHEPADTLTREFYALLEAIIHSPYYTPNPEEACILVPSIDTLNQNRIIPHLVSQALDSLPYWENGANHLLFNMMPGNYPDFNTVIDINTDQALIAGAGFDSWTYREGFDISLPMFSPLLFDLEKISIADKPSYLIVSTQMNLYQKDYRLLRQITREQNSFLLLQQCNNDPNKHIENDQEEEDVNPNERCDLANNQKYEYPAILGNSTFCLVMRGARLSQPSFLDAMAFNCIPVVVADNAILPFEDVIDWTLACIRIREVDLHSMSTILSNVSEQKVIEMREQVKWLYQKYFKDIDTIVITALDVLNDRIFSHVSKNYKHWNLPENRIQNPLFLPMFSPKNQGFTAVILTYDRIESLFTLIEKLSVVRSLQKILVVWNNQKKSPPIMELFPKVGKPIKVIQTKANKLSNRFYPYDEIETEAILTIDDDIIMMTADELDFGYEVWCEFPDRIVGFPSRTHVWDNETMRWKYESEWTNEVSMVLTGASFHHKYWSWMYTNAMPSDIKEWVDANMNCEDIGMNFLVANITGKAPIKVTPRKKFKCPECIHNEMLSADLNHMMERSACIDRFAKVYGMMPLKTVEFRADPVLYKDNFPAKLKRFNNIGSL